MSEKNSGGNTFSALCRSQPPINVPEELETFIAQFNSQLEYGEIMHFTAFHNHEIDSRFNNIIDYIKNKVMTHFIRLGKLPRDSAIKDLRYTLPQFIIFP